MYFQGALQLLFEYPLSHLIDIFSVLVVQHLPLPRSCHPPSRQKLESPSSQKAYPVVQHFWLPRYFQGALQNEESPFSQVSRTCLLLVRQHKLLPRYVSPSQGAPAPPPLQKVESASVHSAHSVVQHIELPTYFQPLPLQNELSPFLHVM